MKVYFIAGLGADARIFKNIRLPEGYEMHHLHWLIPFPNESLADYAGRMAQGIDDNAPFIVVGLSMGGMIAAEIAKIKKPKSTILFSSVPTAQQLPKRFRVAQWFRLHKVFPIALLKNISIIKRFFSVDSKEDQLLLIEMIKCCDPQFIRWAINAILQWRNNLLPNPLLHIHGTKDEILPFKFTHPTHAIHKGTHVMILSRAAEINELLQVYLMDENNFHTNLA